LRAYSATKLSNLCMNGVLISRQARRLDLARRGQPRPPHPAATFHRPSRDSRSHGNGRTSARHRQPHPPGPVSTPPRKKFTKVQFVFGYATDTYDAEGEPTTVPRQVILRAEEVETLAARFRGIIEQTPPPFSAKKIMGVPAYKLARQQKEVVLKPCRSKSRVHNPGSGSRLCALSRRVSSGTYMRSIAHEMGRELACGAHLESLRRNLGRGVHPR